LQDNHVHHTSEDKERVVDPRVSIVTLSVSDLGRSVDFYRGGLG
jgi:hypothetical protein